MAATDPAADGPFAATRQTVGVPGTQGTTLTTDVYAPGTIVDGIDPAAVPCPVVVLGHGFLQSKDRHVNQGLQLATRGFIVLVPTFNGGSNHARNGEDIRACIDWVLARNADPVSLLYGAVWEEAIGAGGHSAGGLSAILAAAGDPRIRALSLMDPVDNGGQGVAALGWVTVPVAMTWSEPSACNANGSAEVLYAAARGIRRGMKIVGANHTDPQDPAGFLSILTCGPADPARQALYRRHAFGWFERHLRGDASYEPYVYNYPGGQLASDLGAGLVTYAAVAPLVLSADLSDGAPRLHVAGPSDQAFAVQMSTNAVDWNIRGDTQTAPASLTILPTLPNQLLRTLSLP